MTTNDTDLQTRACEHPLIVPIDAHWGKCVACGDDTFPMGAASVFACGGDEIDAPHDADEQQHRAAVGAYIRDLEEQRDALAARSLALGRVAREAASVLEECIDAEVRASRMYAGGVCPSRAQDVLDDLRLLVPNETDHG